MCLPWNHKWETISRSKMRTYDEDSDGSDLPIDIDLIVRQRCTHCGKEIVRKYRV